jgi:hypothetical protein
MRGVFADVGERVFSALNNYGSCRCRDADWTLSIQHDRRKSYEDGFARDQTTSVCPNVDARCRRNLVKQTKWNETTRPADEI